MTSPELITKPERILHPSLVINDYDNDKQETLRHHEISCVCLLIFAVVAHSGISLGNSALQI